MSDVDFPPAPVAAAPAGLRPRGESRRAQKLQEAEEIEPKEREQSHFQVSFAVGFAGADRIVRDDAIVVWVDALAAVMGRTPDAEGMVVADLTNCETVAENILATQVDSGERAIVAVIAASGCVADMLAAGAVISALGSRGIDFHSPEAAVPCAAFENLRRGATHLVTASVEGQRAMSSVGPARMLAAITLEKR